MKRIESDDSSSDEELTKRRVRLGSVDARKELLKPRTFSSMNDDSARDVAVSCSDLISVNNFEQLKSYLNALPRNIQLHRIIDDDGYTLLHMAAF